jgi:hypothetical protein
MHVEHECLVGTSFHGMERGADAVELGMRTEFQILMLSFRGPCAASCAVTSSFVSMIAPPCQSRDRKSL